jgi:hypothetical protein
MESAAVPAGPRLLDIPVNDPCTPGQGARLFSPRSKPMAGRLRPRTNPSSLPGTPETNPTDASSAPETNRIAPGVSSRTNRNPREPVARTKPVPAVPLPKRTRRALRSLPETKRTCVWSGNNPICSSRRATGRHSAQARPPNEPNNPRVTLSRNEPDGPAGRTRNEPKLPGPRSPNEPNRGSGTRKGEPLWKADSGGMKRKQKGHHGRRAAW